MSRGRWLGAGAACAMVAAMTGPASPSAATARVETPRLVSISASGDILAHNTLYLAARNRSGKFDFAGQLSPVANLLTADVDICHLETPLFNGEPSSYPLFGTPVSLADEIAATGWEGCSVASNHSLDKGYDGVVTTYREMRKRGLKTAGTRPSERESPTAWYTTVNGVRVAQLSYTYGFNGLRPPADKPYLVNRINLRSILSAARWARENGAELVVLSLHWGTEYSSTPNSFQRDLARALTASPNVDVIVGHHAHVLQDAALVNGKPVLYGLGNLWSGQGPWANQPNGQHGAIVTLRFEISDAGARFVGGQYRPTLTIPGSWKVKSALQVREVGQVNEACRAIEDAAERLGGLLNGPSSCPKR